MVQLLRVVFPKEKMKKTRNQKICFLISTIGAPLLAGILLLLVYLIKGIYPFGGTNIAYFDMSQSMVPVYYHIYDMLHGTKSMLWDWYSGGGVSMADTAGSYILSPFNLFFLFVKRDMILESMSYFLLLKVCVCAGIMSFYIRKTYDKTDCIWHVLAGMLYASCGFIIQYYTLINFLDIMILFPLIIYFADRLLKERKITGYIVVMTAGFLNNVYLMFMVCIYLILYFAYDIHKMDAEKRKDRSALVGCTTVVSLCLSAVIFLPTVFSLMDSSRVEIGKDLTSSVLPAMVYNHGYENKLFMPYGCELPLAFLVSLLILKRKELKKLSKEIFLYVLMLIPIFCELTNRLWHMGTYVEFPMRFGYMLTFTGLSMMGKILQLEKEELPAEQNDIQESKWKKWIVYLRIPALAAIPFTFMALYYFMRTFLKSGIRDTSYFPAFWSIHLILFIVFGLVLLSRDKKAIVFVCSLLVISQFGLGWYGFLAPEDMYSIECTDNIVKKTERINDLIEDVPENRINRVKDDSVTLNANYPFIMKQASISNWTLGSKPAFRLLMGQLGYSTDYTRILDNGGTVFSDAVLHVTDCIFKSEPDSQLYSNFRYRDDYLICETNYQYPFGILVTEEIKNWNTNENTSAFAAQNLLFEEISRNTEELITAYDLDQVLVSEKTTEDETYRYVCRIPVTKKSVLYLQNIQDEEDPNYYIFSVNGEEMSIPNLYDMESSVYPAVFNNGLVSLGTFEEETVGCVIESAYPLKENEITFGCLDLEKFEESIDRQADPDRVVRAGKNSLYMEIENDSADYLLLPVGYDSSTKVKVNGKKVIPQAALDDAFYLIPLEKGNNVIEMSFRPAGLNIGILLSVLGLFCLALLYFGKEKIMSCKVVQSVMYVLLMILGTGILLCFYAIPILATIGAKIWFRFYLL